MLICSLLYFQPSNETFKSMLQEIQEKIPNRDGADQGFLTSHYNDLLDRPLFHPPADGSRLTGLYRLPLGYQMDAVYYCKYHDNLLSTYGIGLLWFSLGKGIFQGSPKSSELRIVGESCMSVVDTCQFLVR